MEEGLDTFVVIDGLPKVPEDSRPKLIKFLLRKLTTAGKTKEDNVFMPMDEATGQTGGYAFVEYETSAQAVAACKTLNGTPLDKKHTIAVNKLTDIERYGREGRIDEDYKEPEIAPFEEKEHLRWWLGDHEGRDQFVMYRGENVGVFWNEKEDQPEQVIDRQAWTESFVQWSPKGTFLTSMHAQGVQLWGGPNWSRQKRFMHPGVNLVDFSPNERYLTTWSHRPMQIDEGHPILGADEDGKNYIIWDIATGKPIRSFVTLDLPGPTLDEEGQPMKKKLQWPAFKWSADSKYVARMNPGQGVSVYELPRMNLMDKTSIKIEGIMDFEWCPANPQRADVKTYEQLFCYWTPEMGSNPAKVGLSAPGTCSTSQTPSFTGNPTPTSSASRSTDTARARRAWPPTSKSSAFARRVFPLRSSTASKTQLSTLLGSPRATVSCSSPQARFLKALDSHPRLPSASSVPRRSRATALVTSS
jgi:translation initiation factor 3 subunit B